MKAILPPPSRLLICLLALLPLAAPARDAQAQEGLVDRVVAIVGDSVVLLSEIIQQEQQMQAQGATLPPDNSLQRDSIRQRIVAELIDVQLILQAAARDSLLSVSEERVEESLQLEVEAVEGRFSNRDEFSRALAAQGLTVQTFREMQREQIRKQQLLGLYLQRYLGEGAVEVAEDEMREFFEARRASLQQRPATVTFKQVMMPVASSDSAEAAARSRAEELLERARAGEDFADLATLHSEGPSATAGGDLGWFRRGQMTEAFENAAFALPEGGISDVVKTERGLHIIKVERVRAQERTARHILIRPAVEVADIGRSRRLAGEIAERADSEDFQALIDEYHDGALPDSATLPLRDVVEYFPAAYIGALSQRQAGEIVGPIQFNFDHGEHFAVIKIVEVREVGEYTFEDLEESIRATLVQDKRREALMEGLRAKTYVEIKGY